MATHYGIDAAIRYTDAMQTHLDRLRDQGPKLEEQNSRLQNYHAIITARDSLAAAQKAGNQDAIDGAQAQLKSAVQQARDFDMSMATTGSSPDDKELAQGLKDTKKLAPIVQQYDTTIGLIDNTLKNASPDDVGTRGWLNRNVEGVAGQFDPKTQTPARNFANNIANIQTQIRNLVAKSHYMSPGAVASLDEMITGMDKLDTYSDFQNSLTNMRAILSDQKDELQSKMMYQPGDILTGGDGKKYRVTGGDPSDPDVEPVK